jgi:hypothetical protein
MKSTLLTLAVILLLSNDSTQAINLQGVPSVGEADSSLKSAESAAYSASRAADVFNKKAE